MDITFIIGTYIMKNTKATNKKFNRKLYILLAGMLATSVSATSLEYIEVIEIETTNHSLIMKQAKAELAIFIQNMQLSIVTSQTSAQQLLTVQAEEFNQHITLAKVTLMAE